MRSLTLGDWELARDISEWIEIAAIAVITLGIVVAAVRGVAAAMGNDDPLAVFKGQMAMSLLIGLDLLIAADVIRTVTLEPTLENVSALGLLVLVRTFLAWTLVLETESRWPWQRDRSLGA